MELTRRIETLLQPAASEMGLELVRIRFGGEGRSRALQIMAERDDGTAMNLGECSQLSKTASALLDVEDLIDGPYNLEVSSPGLERPLVKLKDFDRFKGHMAKIELDEPVEGRKRFKGELEGLNEDDNIVFKMEENGETVLLPFSAVFKAKLVLTDDPLASSKQKSKPKKN
ncbi:MAG: ribosome maturation factor RimP [Pseudomonadota bacterium]